MIRKNKLDPAEVGKRIRIIRGGRTLEEFGRMIGVKHPTVYRYEVDRIPSAEILLRIAALDPHKRGLDWLLARSEDAAYIYKEGDLDLVLGDTVETYGSKKRLTLVLKVKKLATEADDEVIEALLRNVEQFDRIPKPKKD